MADKTGIEWADATWNPIVGCSLASPGCTNCYAMSMAARIENIDAAQRLRAFDDHRHLDEMHPEGRDPARTAMLDARTHYAGTTIQTKAGAVWTGKLAPAPENILTQPLRWRRPREVFVNSMGDLFHKDAPRVLVDRAFAVMATANHHTYLVLTKRPDYMREYATAADFTERVADAQVDLGQDSYANQPEHHIFLGTSVEDQHRADDRRAHMAALAAAGWHTFVSYEPALGPVDWTGWEFLSGIISGGESGPRARPTHPDWHRAARDFCAANGIPYFFKQWGEWGMPTTDLGRLDWPYHPDYDRTHWFDKRECARPIEAGWSDKYLLGGGAWPPQPFDMFKTPEFLEQVGRCPQASCREAGCCRGNESRAAVTRVGKARAGRLLDGREHNALPWRAA